MGTIADFPAAAPLDGSELVPLWQGGEQVQMPAAKLPNAATPAQAALLKQTQDARDATFAAEQQALSASSISLIMTRQGFIDPGGNFNANNGYLASDVTPCASGDYVAYSGYGVPAMAMLTFLDASNTRIGGVLGRIGCGYTYGVTRAPANAAFVIGSVGDPASQTAAAGIAYRFERSRILPVAPGPLTTPDAAVESGFLNLAEFCTASGYIDNNGNGPTQEDANWLSSPGAIKVEPGRTIDFDVLSVAAINILSFFAADGTSMGGVAGQGSGATSRTRQSVLIPDGVDSVRICVGNSLNSAQTLQWAGGLFVPQVRYRGFVAPQAGNRIIKPADTIILYGDSRSSTDYAFQPPAVAQVFGCAVLPRGLSGHTVAQNASDADLMSVYGLGFDPRAVLMLLGGNDNGTAGTVGTFSATSVNGIGGEAVVTPTDITKDYANTGGATFIQAIDHAVRKLQAGYANIRARANLTGNEDEPTKNAKIAAVQQVMLWLCTDLPQQRADAGTYPGFSVPANWERKRQACIEVAVRNKVMLVDTMGRIALDMTLEPSWSNPTNKVNNNGVWYMDGLHPNPFLWQRIAELVAAETGLASGIAR